MQHGIDGYFRELERFHRRLSAVGIAVLAVFIAAMFAARQPAIERLLDDPKRFGFEGPDQYVERILLEIRGPEEQIGANAVNALPVSLREGGGAKHKAREGRRPAPEGEVVGEGSGEDEFTLEARLRALSLEGPIVQSDDLIVEELVRPEYPEAARDGDIEGLVELVALVDTTGRVIQVEIIGGTRHPLLDQAATTAVLKCRYRPYRVKENLEQVWAYFRIKFRLY